MIEIKASTRLVILTKKYALKIPFDKRGFLQGKNEAYIWNKYKHTGFFAPLIWQFFGIVCQRRCHEVDDFDLFMVLEIKENIKEFDFLNCDLFNQDNWGLYLGRQVLLDYGINERISKMY